MTTAYSVSLIPADADPIYSRPVGVFASLDKAFAAAKKAAGGRKAEFAKKGVDSGYFGPAGAAWVAPHSA